MTSRIRGGILSPWHFWEGGWDGCCCVVAADFVLLLVVVQSCSRKCQRELFECSRDER